LVRARVPGQLRPAQRLLGGDPSDAGLLQKADEVLQQPFIRLELEAKAAADSQIVAQRRS